MGLILVSFHLQNILEWKKDIWPTTLRLGSSSNRTGYYQYRMHNKVVIELYRILGKYQWQATQYIVINSSKFWRAFLWLKRYQEMWRESSFMENIWRQAIFHVIFQKPCIHLSLCHRLKPSNVPQNLTLDQQNYPLHGWELEPVLSVRWLII